MSKQVKLYKVKWGTVIYGDDSANKGGCIRLPIGYAKNLLDSGEIEEIEGKAPSGPKKQTEAVLRHVKKTGTTTDNIPLNILASLLSDELEWEVREEVVEAVLDALSAERDAVTQEQQKLVTETLIEWSEKNPDANELPAPDQLGLEFVPTEEQLAAASAAIIATQKSA